jgi:thiamine pyrophosphokinase
MKSIIFSGVPIGDYSKIKLETFDLVICADSGSRHAAALGIVPDYIVGDMDSVDPDLLEKLKDKGSRIITFPRDKNEVDTELAIEVALKKKSTEIVIYGGLGERLDHTLANIHLLVYLLDKEIKACLIDDRHRISLVAEGVSARVIGRGTVFSLLPLTFRAEGVRIMGAQWELEDALFEIGKPYGVSNRVLEEYAEISVEKGILILYEIFHL